MRVIRILTICWKIKGLKFVCIVIDEGSSLIYREHLIIHLVSFSLFPLSCAIGDWKFVSCGVILEQLFVHSEYELSTYRILLAASPCIGRAWNMKIYWVFLQARR